MTDLEVENQSMTVIYATSAIYATGQFIGAKTKSGQMYTVQKHTQNRPSMLRSQNKPFFVVLITF